ncbi:MAG TPA: NAD(P)/FAD-dependent oxidoreductase [Acidimicrobiales bacterium]|nr:NAD(P)/FAD-dependent oxidoreductase [Acidimicrobiales bacterium]
MADFTTDLASADDETIAAAVEHAEVHTILPALAAALGDRSLVPDHLRPDPTVLMDPTAGLSPELQAEGRAIAVEALGRLRDTDVPHVPEPDADVLRHLLEYASGGADVDEYLELLRDELGIGDDLRTPDWRKDDLAPDRPYRVAVVGAGMSGLAAAHRLRQAGLDVVVLEKNADVGGTWFENVYPGCRVDVSNLFYSYSFAQRDDWPEHFSSQQVLLDYFRAVADEAGIRPLIRFGTEVTSIELDEATMRWTLQTVDDDGQEEAVIADAVVSAVGQLNRPSLPDIPGVERFEGPAFHSARWDHDIDLEGKRVAVIGTGASAAQFIPVIAEETASLTIFQRTPAWFIPAPTYTEQISPEVRWLRRNVPGYTHWSRFWVFWRSVEGLMPLATVDPEWDGGERSVSASNEMMREMLTAYLSAEFADRPDLLDKVVPQYPPFSKRFILDDGAWARTLKRDDVDLVTEGIAEITAEGVRTVDGTLHEADVIIYGTGFQASDFLTPMKVVGRGGRDLHEVWGGDARAYLGITLPGFPSFFMLYGPNTNIVVNGSIIYFSECEVHYVVGCIREILASGARAIDPKPEVHEAYNERIDEGNLRMAWGVSTVSSWYKNATGRTAQNWPFSLLEYWQQTREPDLDDYEVL